MDFDDDDASVGSSFSSGDFPNDGDEGGFPSSTLCFIFSQYFLFRTSAARVRIFPERNDSFFFLETSSSIISQYDHNTLLTKQIQIDLHRLITIRSYDKFEPKNTWNSRRRCKKKSTN